MGSSKPQDRSLNGNTFFPQWMKGKLDSRFDFDESSFSPPSHDDSFFFIRYPRKKDTPETTPGFKSVNNVLNENKNSNSNANQVTPNNTELTNTKKVDFSKHHPACQPFVTTVTSKPIEANQAKNATSQLQSKSQRTDDGFHSESALCGRSIVQVANQMMSNKITKSGVSEEDAISRKGSKSLPATPIASPLSTPDSSPKSRRRIASNRYFTGPFIPDREKYQSGWILASLLGQSREIVTAKIQEEEEEEPALDTAPHRTLSRKKSISSQNLTYIGKEDKIEDKGTVYANILQPKPSEFREMNCWSPTSM